MPRIPRWLPAVSLLALLVVPGPPASASPAVGDVIHGSGTASAFTIQARGYALHGGAADAMLVCASCLIVVTFTVVDPLLVAVDAGAKAHGPGRYEIREFVGLVTIVDEGPGAFAMTLDGTGRFHAL